MAFIQMTVPLVFWGQRPPAHEITCICRTEEKKGVATGSRTGQVCLWDILRERETEKIKLRPRCLLFGGQSPIVSMCFVKNWTGDRDRIATLSEIGTVSLWDGKDGACLKYVYNKKGHTEIKSCSRARYNETLIALYGQYSEVYILDSNSLETLCTLRSDHNPNWISQVCFISNIEKKEALLALTVDGVAKHWLLPTRNDMKDLEQIFEEKSQCLDIKNPLSLAAAPHQQSGHCSVLIVCAQFWMLYDATGGKMKQMLIHPCATGVKAWMKGEYADFRTVIIWTKENSKAFVYRLSTRCVPGADELDESVNASTEGCSIIHTLSTKDPSPFHAVYLDRYWHIQGDKNGSLYLWDIRKIRDSMALATSQPCSNSDPIFAETSSAISDSWDPPALPCGLCDVLYPQESVPPTITCALYLTSFGRLVCGQADGCVAVLSANQAATVLMLQPRKFSRGWPQHCILKGHKGKVKCLLHPYSHSKAYNSDYLVSGGSDFTVKLWDLYSGVLVHTFTVHGGEVKNIVSCPPEINPRLQTCVCSIAEDYSVAILSTSERKCLLVAACHSSPVVCVRWRLEEDFLLVSCRDGKLFVWQIETGSLDRCIEGENADTILNNTPEISHVPILTPNTPLQVCSLNVGSNDSLIQVLLFDPQTLIMRLGKIEKMSKDIPKKAAPIKQVDAFKTYLYARRHFGTGSGLTPGGRGQPPSRRASLPVKSLSQAANRPGAGMETPSREQERAREVMGQGVANQTKTENLKEEDPRTIVDIVRLLLSCLHAWNLDEDLDKSCEGVLGLVRPRKPVSFGLLSKGGRISIVLPGWGLRQKPHLISQHSLSESMTTTSGSEMTDSAIPASQMSTTPTPSLSVGTTPTPSLSVGSLEKPKSVSIPRLEKQSSRQSDSISAPSGSPRIGSYHSQTSQGYTFDQKYHIRWQLSRSLTTQHLLTMVSITNTLMNQSRGAHELAASSGVQNVVGSPLYEEDSDEENEDSQTQRDNQIRAVWSQVAALHCVMLPERMEGKFRAPHLPVLASRFLDHCQAIREAAQALLQAELRRIGMAGRKELIKNWAFKLHSPSTFKTSATEGSKVKHFVEETDMEGVGPIPTQQQQSTALIILGMIGAEFHDAEKAEKRRLMDVQYSGRKELASVEVMDPAIARQTAKTLQAVLLEKPHSGSTLHSNLRCSAAELLGRGFQLWEKYVDIPQVVMGLLDLVIQYVPLVHPHVRKTHSSPDDSKRSTLASSRSTKFASDVARKALNLMIILRPVTMVTTLAKEVATYLAHQHVTHFPHSQLQPIQVGTTPPPSTAGIVTQANTLLPSCKDEILDLMKTVIEKCSQQVSLQLLEVVDVVLYCFDQEKLKKRNILEMFPSFSRMPNISYSAKSKRLAVGARSGQVGIYDLKQSRTQLLQAHTHPVTVLSFSEDGKLLATYAYGDSKLNVWQLGTSVFGINQAPKFVNSWPAISSSSPSTYSSYIRLEWAASRSIILHMPGGVECKYSL